MEYDAKQVATHNTPEDTWLVIHGKVYDLTKYMIDHPGGPEIINETAGLDASENFDNAGHSEDAFDIMKDLCVGTIKGFKKKAAKPARVQINRKPDAPETDPGRPLSKLVNQGIFMSATTAIYFLAFRSHHVPKAFVDFIRDSSNDPHRHGFFKGLLIGAGAFSILDLWAGRRFTKAFLHRTKGFESYPAHIKMPPVVEKDELLQSGWLDPVNYSNLPLKAKKEVAPNVWRFTFSLPTENEVLGLPIGQHVAIKANVNGENVSRSYTPVSNNHDKGILELVIKIYPDGKLTNGLLSNIEVGDTVPFRGPKGAMRYHRGLCKNIGMVAGGTGITPMYQLIRAICEDDRDLTHVSLIYANKSEEDILLRKELDAFARKYPQNFEVYYVVDNPPPGWKYGSGHVNQELMKKKLPGPKDGSKMMLCGPPGMVNACKAGLGNLGFPLPGVASKITDQIFLF
ncbi:hypothetical protein CDD80_6896 [Ophiocordyceps camponoti-rufipedis]|uniref:Cytochrome-b5 reductase n=1 Tax=Ophiocordyceps camponoti-rufipedis TaxID=2004952 RepID=A0A2C5ZLA9_9HYPO|nr:hypothetical protein CDD80_6896 [Ophiocordyceps camponoti-rufipedis]